MLLRRNGRDRFGIDLRFGPHRGLDGRGNGLDLRGIRRWRAHRLGRFPFHCGGFTRSERVCDRIVGPSVPCRGVAGTIACHETPQRRGRRVRVDHGVVPIADRLITGLRSRDPGRWIRGSDRAKERPERAVRLRVGAHDHQRPAVRLPAVSPVVLLCVMNRCRDLADRFEGRPRAHGLEPLVPHGSVEPGLTHEHNPHRRRRRIVRGSFEMRSGRIVHRNSCVNHQA